MRSAAHRRTACLWLMRKVYMAGWCGKYEGHDAALQMLNGAQTGGLPSHGILNILHGLAYDIIHTFPTTWRKVYG